jgi:hypothetical protein
MAAAESADGVGTPGSVEDESNEISAMLLKSKKEGEKRRRRISTTCTVVGTVGIVGGGTTFRAMFMIYGTMVAARHLVSYIACGVMLCSVSIALLGVLPTDVTAIKVANRLAILTVGLFTVFTGAIAWVFLMLGLRDGSPSQLNGPLAAIWMACACLVSAISLARLVATSFLTQRERLDQIWRVYAQWLMATSVVCVSGPALFLNLRNSHLIYILNGILFVNGAICGWPNFRTRAQAFLSSRGETRILAPAVAVAIGNNSVEEVQQKASRFLRYVTLDKISKEELAENKPNPLLYERSMVGKFGDVDAFISHSWSDPSDSKWESLQAWRKRFKARHGREPKVWFDKYCLDQLSIDDSLMCLPVHLSTCKQIIMLVGPSYLSRLWCIVEIFLFSAAVNDMTRVECIALEDSTENASKAKAEEDVRASFRSFTVNKCQCHGKGTRDKLLSIIEAGCGTLESFETLIRNFNLSFGSKSTSKESPSKVAREARHSGSGAKRARWPSEASTWQHRPPPSAAASTGANQRRIYDRQESTTGSWWPPPPPPDIRLYSSRSFGLHFADAATEKEYFSTISADVNRQFMALARIMVVFTLMILLVTAAPQLIVSGVLKLDSLSILSLIAVSFIVSGAVYCPNMFRVGSRQKEYVFSGLLFLMLIMVLLGNPFRLRRLFSPDGGEVGVMDAVWLKDCSEQLTESARDTNRVCVTLLLHSLFHIFVKVRSKVTFFVPFFLGLFIAVAVILRPSVVPEDGGNFHMNVFLLLAGCFSQWCGSYYNELQHRLVWALEREAADREPLYALLSLVFSAVVRVRNGNVSPKEALIPQFGVQVSSLDDLPAAKSNNEGPSDLEQLVERVRSSGLPQKLNSLTIRPCGQQEIYRCSACAVLSADRQDVMMGFEVCDSWTTTAAAGPAAQQAEQPQQPSDMIENDELGGVQRFDELSDSSAFQSDLSSGMRRQDARRVSFDILDTSHAVVDKPAARNSRKQKRDKRAALYKTFMIESSCIHTNSENKRIQFSSVDQMENLCIFSVKRAELHTTPVDVHSRGESSYDPNLIFHEAQVLQACRHPNILLMLGVVLDYPLGPVLVMERAWGSVMAALRLGPLRTDIATDIATQIASALEYLHDNGIVHGQVGTHTVLLRDNPEVEPVTAKLANFSRSKTDVTEATKFSDDLLDDGMFWTDLPSFGVFLHCLFAKSYRGSAELEQLSRLSVEELQGQVELPELGLLLHSIFERSVASARQVAKWFHAVGQCAHDENCQGDRDPVEGIAMNFKQAREITIAATDLRDPAAAALAVERAAVLAAVERIAATDLRDPAAAVRQPASPPVRRPNGASGDARQPTTYFSL